MRSLWGLEHRLEDARLYKRLRGGGITGGGETQSVGKPTRKRKSKGCGEAHAGGKKEEKTWTACKDAKVALAGILSDLKDATVKPSSCLKCGKLNHKW